MRVRGRWIEASTASKVNERSLLNPFQFQEYFLIIMLCN